MAVDSSLDNSTTVQYISNFSKLVQLSKNLVRDIDPANDLSFLRVRSKKHEVLVSSGNVEEQYSHKINYNVQLYNAKKNMQFHIFLRKWSQFSKMFV